MTRTTYLELLVALVLLGITILFLNPFHFWMPDMALVLMLACLVAVFGAFATLVLREQAHDEREETHRMRSGRAAFLVGALILVAGIAYQGSVVHEVDPWLVVALVGMVLAKLSTRIYSDLRL